MPVFDISDPQTGYSVTLEGDSPPTEQELEEIFRVVDAQKRPVSGRTAIPEPGEGSGSSVAPGPILSVPQAFPAVEQGMAETAKVPALSAEEAEQLLTTPQVSIPRGGKPGTVLRGLTELGAGLVEQATLTPAAPVLGLSTVVPGVRAAAGMVMSAGAAKGAAEKLGEASVTGNPQTITEGLGLAAMAGLGAAATGIDIARSRPGAFARELAAENRAKPPVIQEVAPLTAKALEVQKVAEPEPVKAPEPETLPAPEPETASPKPAAESEVQPKPQEVVSTEPVLADDLPKRIDVDPDTFNPTSTVTPKEKVVGISQAAKVDDIATFTKDVGKRWFTVKGHLPEEVQTLKREMEGQISKADLDVKVSTTALMDAITEHYGIGAIGRAGGGSRKIPQAAVETMDAYLKGQVANPTAIPPGIRGALDTMRAEIDGWSQKVSDKLQVQANRHPAGSPEWTRLNDLAEKIQNNMDVYVHRSYRFFDSKKPAPQWYADIPLGIKNAAEQFVTQNAPYLTPDQARSRLLRWLSDLKDETTGGPGGKLGSKDLSMFMRRKVIAPEIRAVLGEYKSPLMNYARSVTKMSQWLAKQKFLEDVRSRGMGVFLFEEGGDPPGFNARIAAEGTESMSPLNGLRTSDEIARAFKEMDSVPTENPAARAYLMLNGWTKFAATGLSLLTQARNLLSRPFMAMWAGHWDFTKVPEAIRMVAAETRGRMDAATKAKLARAKELLILDDAGRSGEIRAVMKDAALQEVAPGELYSWSALRAIKHYGYRVPESFYKASDNLGSLVGWLAETETQAKLNPTLPLAEIEARAAKITREIYPYYSETPKIVRAFRKAPVGTFVTFPYQMIRVIWNGLARSVHEIRSANPAEQAVGYKRLGSQMATLTAAYGLQEAAKLAMGISTKQEDDFRRFQPPWSRNSKWLFTDKDQQTGELGAINLSYLDPFSYATDPLVATLRTVREGGDLFETFTETTMEMFSPWTTEQILVQAIIEARNGVTDTGREIYNKTDDPWEKFTKQTRHVMDEALMPGTVQRVQKRILPAARNEQPVFGRKLELAPEIARELTGIAVEKFSFKNGLAFRAKEFAEDDRAAESIFHRTLSQTQTTAPADIFAAYQESDRRRFEIWSEIRRDFLAAVRQGVSTREAIQLMNARGVSQRDARLIANGMYEPMPVSDQSRDRARERNRVIPMEQIQRYRAENRKALPAD